MLERTGFVHGDIRGMSAHANPVATLLNLYRRAQGKISYQELGRRLAFHESNNLSVSYMGYAIRADNESNYLSKY